MKKLSTEEKIKAYDEALEKAVKMHRNYKGRVRAVDVVIEEVFPELKESEDERMIREIKRYIKEQGNKPTGLPNGTAAVDDMLAWLEKQGEKLVITDEEINDKAFKAYPEMIYQDISSGWMLDKNKDKRDGYIHALSEMFIIQHQQKPTEIVEPKFKVGDWVVYNRNDHSKEILQIYDIRDNRYYFNDDIHLSWSIKECDEKSHLWTIQDAKDSDVLVCPKYAGDIIPNIFIFKNINIKDNDVYCYCSFLETFITGGYVANADPINTDFYPATKEQRNLLFQKMKEAGYEWDMEHKQLRKIENEIEIPFGAKDSELQEAIYYIPKGFHAEIDDDKVVIKKGEQKPTWSKEDDKILKSIIINIENLQFSEDMQEKYRHIPNANKSYYQIKIDWLKSLKDRVLPQPKQEWSEEDEKNINFLCELLTDLQVKSTENEIKHGTNSHSEYYYNIKKWLKSLRPQSQLKWSEEDERNLDWLMTICNRIHYKSDPQVAPDSALMLKDWLKSLSPQNRWKPSDEQMKALDEAIAICSKRYRGTTYRLDNLRQDLKKLKK